MAADAVLKIQSAEEAGGEIIKNAQAEARELMKKAEADGLSRKKAIVDDARLRRDAIIAAAQDAANKECVLLDSQAEQELAVTRNPDEARFHSAVKLVVERIVNAK